jgi:Holliday junction resolvase
VRRTRAPGAGNARELAVMKVLADEGWLCASRRHIGGAGDILAVLGPPTVSPRKRQPWAAMLIEVKSTARNPWNDFGPADRQAMVETAAKHGVEPVLAWWPPRGKLRWLRPSEWPTTRSPDPQLEVET